MNQSDRIKVCNAGFTILRDREIYPVHSDMFGDVGASEPCYEIWAINGDHSSWFKFAGPFPGKAARERKKKEYLNDPMVIED